MRCRIFQCMMLLVFFPSSTTMAFAGSLSLPENSTVCADASPIMKLTCRIHQEAIWSVASQLYGVSKRLGLEAAPSGQRPGAVEEDILAVAETLRSAHVEFGDLRTSYQLQVILSALDAVPVIVSSATYAYALNSGIDVPHSETEVLQATSGLCGNAAEIFESVLRNLGLTTRTAQFWWRDDQGRSENHVAVEVLWNGAWRLYDPTFGAYFVAGPDGSNEVLDTASARNNTFTSIVNRNGTTYRYWKLAGLEPFDYLRHPDVDVIIGGKGIIHVPLTPNLGGLTTTFANIPNFVGDNQVDGRSEGLVFRFPKVSGHFDATVTGSASAGCQSSIAFLNDRSFPSTAGVHVICDVADPSIFQIKGSDDVCYLVLSTIRFDPVNEPAKATSTSAIRDR